MEAGDLEPIPGRFLEFGSELIKGGEAVESSPHVSSEKCKVKGLKAQVSLLCLMGYNKLGSKEREGG